MSQRAREDQLQRKAVVLEYFTRRRGREPRRRARGLSARQRRALRLFDIKPEQQRYLPSCPPGRGASRFRRQGAAFPHPPGLGVGLGLAFNREAGEWLASVPTLIGPASSASVSHGNRLAALQLFPKRATETSSYASP